VSPHRSCHTLHALSMIDPSITGPGVVPTNGNWLYKTLDIANVWLFRMNCPIRNRNCLHFASTCVHPRTLVRPVLLFFYSSLCCGMCCYFVFFFACMLPVFVDCPFSIAPSIFTNVYYPHWTVVFVSSVSNMQLNKRFILGVYFTKNYEEALTISYEWINSSYYSYTGSIAERMSLFKKLTKFLFVFLFHWNLLVPYCFTFNMHLRLILT
jgi:hypothetical protein